MTAGAEDVEDCDKETDEDVSVDAGIELETETELETGIELETGTELETGAELEAGAELETGEELEAGAELDTGAELETGAEDTFAPSKALADSELTPLRVLRVEVVVGVEVSEDVVSKSVGIPLMDTMAVLPVTVSVVRAPLVEKMYTVL